MLTLFKVGYTPDMLREQIAELKGYLTDKNAPFGVDLLLPQVGAGARKTNYDYTKGKLGDLVDIIIESGAKLFVSAVGVPPKAIVDKLHANGVLYMNMIVSEISNNTVLNQKSEKILGRVPKGFCSNFCSVIVRGCGY